MEEGVEADSAAEAKQSLGRLCTAQVYHSQGYYHVIVHMKDMYIYYHNFQEMEGKDLEKVGGTF